MRSRGRCKVKGGVRGKRSRARGRHLGYTAELPSQRLKRVHSANIQDVAAGRVTHREEHLTSLQLRKANDPDINCCTSHQQRCSSHSHLQEVGRGLVNRGGSTGGC